MIKGISHQSHIKKESLFIEYDIKSGFLSNTESILLHYASRCYMWFWQTGSSDRCQLTKTLRSRAWQKSQHHQRRNVFSHRRRYQWGKSSFLSNNTWIVPLNYPITPLLTIKKHHEEMNRYYISVLHNTSPLLTSQRELNLDEKVVDFLSSCLLLNSLECLSKPVSSTFVPNLLWRQGASGRAKQAVSGTCAYFQIEFKAGVQTWRVF